MGTTAALSRLVVMGKAPTVCGKAPTVCGKAVKLLLCVQGSVITWLCVPQPEGATRVLSNAPTCRRSSVFCAVVSVVLP